MKVLAAAPLLLSLLARAPSAPLPAPTTYQGTVQAVQPKTASLDLVTGMGFALRLVHIRTLPTTQVASAGATLSFAGIKPGDIVRAECHITDAGPVADRIEKLGPQGSRSEPVP